MTSTSCSIRKPPSRRSASSPTSYVSTLKKGRTKSIPSTPTMTRRVVRSDSRCPTRVSSAVKSTSSSLRVGSSFLASSAPSALRDRVATCCTASPLERDGSRGRCAPRAFPPEPRAPPVRMHRRFPTRRHRPRRFRRRRPPRRSRVRTRRGRSPRRPARVMKSGTSRSSDNVAMASSQK